MSVVAGSAGVMLEAGVDGVAAGFLGCRMHSR